MSQTINQTTVTPRKFTFCKRPAEYFGASALCKTPFLLSTIFFCHAALASKPVMTRMLDSTTYQTELAAVTAMGLAYLEDSTKNDVEHMGAILKTPNGRFGITHGRNRPGKDEFRFTTTLTHPRSQLPKGMHTGKQISHIDLRNISRS